MRQRTMELTATDERLLASEERFRLLIQGVSSHAIFMLDPDGKVASWNPGAERIKGYKAEEIIGRHFSCFHVADNIASGKPQHALQVAVAQGYFEDEGLRVRKDGSHFWATVTITPMYDDARQPIGFVKIIQDISRRKAFELELQEAACFNRATLDGLSAQIAILDQDGAIIAVNKRWEDFAADNGLASGSASIGSNYLTACDNSAGPYSERSSDIAAGIRRVLDGSSPQFVCEYAFHTPDAKRWFIVRVTPFPGQGRGRAIVSHENLTELKKEADALQEVEQRLAFALQRSHTGGWDLDLVDHTAHRTLEHDRIFGYESLLPDWSYERFLEHVLPDDRAEVDRLFQQAIAAQAEWGFECRIRRIDGEVRWIWATGGHYRDGDGQVRRMAGIVQDITERKLASETLRERERLLEIVTGSARVGLVVVGPGYRYLFANAAYAEIFGLSTREIVGRRVPDVLAEGWPQIQPRLDRALAGERVTYELTLPALMGGQAARYFDVVYEPQTGDNEEATVVVVVVDVSERKRSEMEQNKLIGLIELSQDYIGVADPRGQVTFMNASGRRLIGIGEADDLGQLHFTDFVAPQWQRFFHETVIGTTREQGHWEGEMQLRHLQTGALIDVYRSTFVLRDVSGQISGYGTVTRDITEQKRSQEALQASEERLRLMIEAVNDHAIFMLDPSGHILTWNRGAEQIEGYTAEEIIGRHYSCLFTPEGIVGGLPQRELELAAVEGRASVEGWRVRKNGSRFWANGTLAALYDNTRRVMGFTKITRDLTAKRRNDELLHSVLDHTLDGIISIDECGTISMINHAAERLFGFSASEVVGQNVSILMPESYDREHVRYLANYLRTGEAGVSGISSEFQGRRKDGSTFPIDLAVTEFRLDDQRNFVGIVRDISEKKKLEAQFHQSQKMEAFGQLAGGVAHDFNNLLSVISGYSDLLLEMLPAEDANRDMVSQIRQAGERATALTRQLLAFSRRQVLEPRVLDLNAVILDIERMLRRLIGEDIEFAIVLNRNISSVKVDPGQIEQVIMNLAVNARDAMPQGGKLTIETSELELDGSYVKAHQEARSGRFVLLAISDTGCGMTADVKARLFEPFFSTKGVGKGTGLGLAVVHGIVKQSNGSIEVYSEVGVGATFKIYLPAVAERATDPLDHDPASSARGDETILLVEDEDGVRGFVARALRGFGYTVLEAPGGPAAFQLIANHQQEIDLLITDVVMPGMSGRQLAEALLASHPQLKVLYMSGYTDDAIVRNGVLQANVDFLQKPFSLQSLASKVREALSSH